MPLRIPPVVAATSIDVCERMLFRPAIDAATSVDAFERTMASELVTELAIAEVFSQQRQVVQKPKKMRGAPAEIPREAEHQGEQERPEAVPQWCFEPIGRHVKEPSHPYPPPSAGAVSRFSLLSLGGGLSKPYRAANAAGSIPQVSDTCEHPFVTAQGSALTRYRRALERRHIFGAEVAAKEMAYLSLRDALGLFALYAGEDPPKYGKAATRWLGRLALESDDLSLDDVQRAGAALQALPRRPDSSLQTLTELSR